MCRMHGRIETALIFNIASRRGHTVNANLHADLGLEGKVAIVAGGGAAGDGIGNGRAAAILLVAAERARDLPHRPCYLLGAAAGSEYRNGAPVHNAPLYGTSSFTTVAPRAFAMAGIGAADVDVAQSYENFTGGVLMSLVEHGFFAPEEANDFLTLDNLRADGGAGTPPKSDRRPGGRGGKLPLNTSGGNLAECYMHGLELNIEAVRQVRGLSPNQVEGAEISVVGSGPMVTPVSSTVFGAEAAL